MGANAELPKTCAPAGMPTDAVAPPDGVGVGVGVGAVEGEELLPHAAANASNVTANTTRRVVIRFSIGTRFNAPPPCFHSNDAARRIADVYTGFFKFGPTAGLRRQCTFTEIETSLRRGAPRRPGREPKPCLSPATSCSRTPHVGLTMDRRDRDSRLERHRRQRCSIVQYGSERASEYSARLSASTVADARSARTGINAHAHAPMCLLAVVNRDLRPSRTVAFSSRMSQETDMVWAHGRSSRRSASQRRFDLRKGKHTPNPAVGPNLKKPCKRP